jgi:DNA replication and repair protein RecF
MVINSVRLKNFRNFKSKLLKFSPETTVVVGPNASGKTNILEVIYLLSTGKSFRARVEEEMIRHRQEISHMKGRIYEGAEKTDLEVVLTRGEITVGEDPDKKERAPRKKLLVNGISRRLFNFTGNFRVVLFGPWDLDLVTESPSIRRKFLDFVLSQVDREYYRASLSYEKGLRQRNRLLLRIREENLPRSQLIFWDRLLIKNGNYISTGRAEFIDFVNETKDFPAVLNSKTGVEDYSLEYDKSIISEARLGQYAEEEVAAATTLVGPHRDDFYFKLRKNRKARDLARYGSRGEQRMGVLWLKLAELAFIEDRTKGKPTLLLDDIFSELDHEHRGVVIEFIKGQQTIITTADPHFVENLKKVEKVELR